MARFAGTARRLVVVTLPLACSFDAGGIGQGSGLESVGEEAGGTSSGGSSTTIGSGATLGSSDADTSSAATTEPPETTATSTTGHDTGGSSSEGPASSETTGPPDPCAGPPPYEVTLEAADATLAGMMMLGTLGNGQQYLYSPTANDGTATFTFVVDCPGEYVIWAYVYDGDPLIADAFGTAADRMQVDLGGDSTDWHYGCQTGLLSWTWETVASNDELCLAEAQRVYALEPGEHSVVFSPTEDGAPNTNDPGEAAALQRIVVSNDLSYAP